MMTERTKKIILWSATVAVSIGLFSWWVKNAQRKLEGFRGGEFMEKLNFPELEEIIQNAEEISTTTE